MPEESKPVRTNYPANSHTAKQGEPTEKEKVEPVATGKVIQRKKPLGKRIAETFTGDDAKSVGEYIIFDVFVPAAKAMLADAASQGAERLLFGEVRGRRPAASSQFRPGYTSYNKMSSSPTRAFEKERPGPELSRRARTSHDFSEIVLESRGIAEDVIEGMGNMLDKYGVVTVSDLYDLVGITGNFTDDKWGWFDLRSAGIQRIREGYLLNLAKPDPID